MRCLMLLLSLAMLVPSAAQESTGFASTWHYPIAKELGEALRKAVPPPGPPTTVARFVPGPSSGTVEALAQALAARPVDQQELLQTMAQLRDVYDKSAAEEGRTNSLAAAYTFFIACNLTVYYGIEPTQAANDALFAQVETAIAATSTFSTLSDADKQAMHDWLIAMAGVVLTTFISADTAQSLEAAQAAQALAATAMMEVLDLDPKGITLDEKGLTVIPEL